MKSSALGDNDASASDPLTVWTIGHSNQSAESFLELLRQANIDTLADVRSQPSSRYLPQYDSAALRGAVEEAGLRYAYFGDSLGGRPPETWLYDDTGHVRYDGLSEHPRFVAGIEKLIRGVRRGLHVALMCSEEDPTVCHRHLLVGRVLAEKHGIRMLHLRADGRTQTDDDANGPPPPQPSLFEEVEEEGIQKPWRSIPSVLHKRTPSGSSED